tara:strand:+ start:11104 stop:11289 length:186 start_codon:yes stop_codon:yes gene_type:complete
MAKYSAQECKDKLGISAAAAKEMAEGRMIPTEDQIKKLEGCEVEEAATDPQMTLSLGDDEE